MADEENGIFHGPLHSDVAGRTDHLPLHTSNGAYVIPAYAVSHLGENNTTAGLKLLKRVFGGVPYSRQKLPYGKERGAYDGGTAPYGGTGVYGQELQPRAKGGKTRGSVPVVVAGGEYIVSPEEVAAIGGGDVATGHAVLDKFVDHIKKEHIKTLKKLPGPQK